MIEQNGSSLDSALAIVRGARPRSSADDRDDERVIAAAVLAGAVRHRRWVRNRATVALGLGAAIAAGVALGVLSGGTAPGSSDGELLAIELSTGDAIAAVPGAGFAVEADAPGVRRLRLDRGAMLFDVTPLVPGDRFEVVTPDATIVVVGTVFAVETSAAGTVVEVFEGRVRVRDARGERSLGAGEILGADRSRGGLARLGGTGRAAARRRAEAGAPVLPPAIAGDAPAAPELAILEARTAARPAAPSDAPAIGGPIRSRTEPASPETATSAPGGRARRTGADALDPAQVRAWIGAGRAEDALATARAQQGGAWRFVEGDALRALRRWDDAARAYDAAIADLEGIERARAAYLCATLRVAELDDLEGALATLDRGQVDAPESALRERGWALRARALERLGRDDALADLAAAYLERFPEGSRAEWMRARLVARD